MKRSPTPGDAGRPDAGTDDTTTKPSRSDAGDEAATGARRRTLGVKPAAAADAPAAGNDVPARKSGLRTRFLPSADRRGTGKPPERQAVPPSKDSDRTPRPPRKNPPHRPPSATGDGPARRTANAPAAGRTSDRSRSRAPDVVRSRPAAPSVPPPAQTDAPEGVRLSKIMSERGLCSRREADEIIERGWVFVDGQRVSELGIRIDPNAEITLAAQAKRRQMEQVTILLHKPVGYVSGQPEPGFEPAVSLIGPDNQFDRADAQRFHPSHLKGIAPAGRLDIDSTGLLVLTQDGRIARQLIGDDSKVEKEYLVRVEGRLDERGLALLNHGLELDGRTLRPAKVEWLNEDQLRFVLREGRKRQIRRMCELVGLKVVGLKRVRIGRVKLGDLPLGQWRFLREDERF
ncbi:pseudouridine synthase [Aromatoleum aromaticum]|uniref:pseudouridine synthase n=1 Tax=Aromatoleum aromaticum TaxID=551760 RepID=UPI0012FF4344|nr:pseudouridine synthase [Aromatoleum aromaticum]